MCALFFFLQRTVLELLSGKCVCLDILRSVFAKFSYATGFSNTYIHIYDMWLLTTGLRSAYFNFNYATMFVRICEFCGAADWYGNGAAYIVFAHIYLPTLLLYHMFQWWFAFPRMLIDVQARKKYKEREWDQMGLKHGHNPPDSSPRFTFSSSEM